MKESFFDFLQAYSGAYKDDFSVKGKKK